MIIIALLQNLLLLLFQFMVMAGPALRSLWIENVRDDQTMLFSGTKEKFGFFEFCFDLWL